MKRKKKNIPHRKCHQTSFLLIIHQALTFTLEGVQQFCFSQGNWNFAKGTTAKAQGTDELFVYIHNVGNPNNEQCYQHKWGSKGAVHFTLGISNPPKPRFQMRRGYPVGTDIKLIGHEPPPPTYATEYQSQTFHIPCDMIQQCILRIDAYFHINLAA